MGVGTVIKLYKKSFLLVLITPSLKGYQEAHSTKVGGNIPSAAKKRNYTNLKKCRGYNYSYYYLKYTNVIK